MHQNIVHQFSSCSEILTLTEEVKQLKVMEGLTKLKECVTEIIYVQVEVV